MTSEPNPVRLGSFRSAVSRLHRLSNRFLQNVQVITVLDDEEKFHFDNFMLFGGLWFKPLKTYLNLDSANVSTESEKAKERKLMLIKCWCLFIAFFQFWPAFLRWILCWIVEDDVAVRWLQDLSGVGRK